MTQEQQKPQIRNVDPGLLGPISLEGEINMLRQNPALACEDLFSAKKMQDAEYPDMPGVRVELGTPIEVAVSGRSDVQQDLMAVIALGSHVALGVVKGKDQSGSEVSYLSLLNNDRTDNDGRARFVELLTEGSSISIGRERIEEIVGRENVVPGVSRTHCVIELKDGILTVIDQSSTNGTSVFTNKTEERTRQFNSIHVWTQPSADTKQLIERKTETEGLSRSAQLGRFTVDTAKQ